MEIVKAKSGVIHFKMPNLIETPRFLGEVGLSSSDNINQYEVYSKILEKMGKFIKKVDVNVGEKKIETYEELWELPEWRSPLYKLANKILSSMSDGLDDKKK